MQPSESMITKMQVLCMFLLISSLILVQGCAYPEYLQRVRWVDETNKYDVMFDTGTFNEYKDVLHGRVNWTCHQRLREWNRDIVLSNVYIFQKQLFRCELYHKLNSSYVHYISLSGPVFKTGADFDVCNICKGHGIEHILRANDAKPLTGSIDITWGCENQHCDVCQQLEEDTGTLQDEASSLEYILRKWFSDTRQQG